jgi:malic enzyme
MINAAKIKSTEFSDEKHRFLGAGSVNIGVADLICSTVVQEGLTLKAAPSQVYLFASMAAGGHPQKPRRLCLSTSLRRRSSSDHPSSLDFNHSDVRSIFMPRQR